MIYEVAIGDRVRTVGIVRKGSLLHVDLDGRLHLVDARRINESIVSMLVQLDGAAAPSRSIDAAFATQPVAGDFDVHLQGRTIAVQIRPAGAFGRQKKAGTGAAGSGPQRVTSPMPGKVVRILVKPGDEVKARQGVAVVEAMKMENELRAARDGRVREVSVAEGQSVDAGTLLLIVD
ncbi:MAG: biotin/lipoyl-containing protein [Vicinamibacterales bacterium]